MRKARTAPVVMGVYEIRSVRGHVYVGSSRDVFRRLLQHFDALRAGTHRNRHLQNAWAKYGPDAFTAALLEAVAEVAGLGAAEQRHLDAIAPGSLLNHVLTVSRPAAKADSPARTRRAEIARLARTQGSWDPGRTARLPGDPPARKRWRMAARA